MTPFHKIAFGVWPPGMPVFEKLQTTLNLYLDPVGGDDSKVGTSRVNAVKTPERIASLIALYAGDVDVHMRSGVAVLPARGWFLPPRASLGLLRFFADETWDPNVYDISVSAAALAGTTRAVVKSSGLVVDALTGQSLRFVTGDAAGQYRRIRNNTATDIVPIAGFAPPPNPGDTYEIFANNCGFQAPSGAVVSAEQYTFCGDAVGMPHDFSESFPYGVGSSFPETGIVLDGLNLLPSADDSYDNFIFGSVELFLYGVELRDPDGAVGDWFRAVFDGTRCNSGVGVTSMGAKDGWGLSSDFLGPCLRSALIIGYVVIDQINPFEYGDGYQNSINLRLYGGRSTRIACGQPLDLSTARVVIGGDNALGTPEYLIRGTGASNALTVARGNIFDFSFVTIEAGSVLVEAGGQLNIRSDVNGAPTSIALRGGAKVCCYGAVNLGGVGADWSVPGVAAFNKSFFGAANTFKFGADGSLVYRL